MNSRLQTESLLFASPPNSRSRRLLQDHDTLISQVQLGASVLLSVLALLALAVWRDGVLQPQYRYLAMIVALMMLGIYKWRGVYRRFDGRINGCLRIARSWLFLVGLVVAAIFVSRTSEDFSRAVILSWAVVGYLTQVATCQLFFRLSHHLKTNTMPIRRALVIGSDALAAHLISSVNRNDWVNDRIVGSLAAVDTQEEDLRTSVPCFGGLDRLANVVARHKIHRVFIALPLSQSQKIEQICNDLSGGTVDIVWIPDIFSMRLLNHSVKELNGMPLITLSESPLAASEPEAFAKAVMDKSIALLMLIALSPLMLTVALLVALTSHGPIIFRQHRHGWDGRIIEVWKFRSMRVHNDTEASQAKRNDSRVTAVGKFIRRTSIDELPQLFNVLQGTMSLVGPRPHAIQHNEFYSQHIPAYMLRHRIKPGITGLAQVSGCRGETETLDKMLKRVEFDIQYINRWSIWLDIVVLVKTPFSLLSKDIY